MHESRWSKCQDYRETVNNSAVDIEGERILKLNKKQATVAADYSILKG